MVNLVRLVLVIFFVGAISCEDSDEKELYEMQYENPETDAEMHCASLFETDECLDEACWEECLAAYEECGESFGILDSCPPQFVCD